jgi:putative restriction endonuclease
MPACDVHGSPFVEAAHIKPHKAANSTVSHRAHILNGLCLCRHCHSAFDDGLFSINENNAVMLSSRLAALKHQHPKFVIEQSKDRRIRTPLVGKPPCGEFVRYHREKVFRNDAVA